MQVLAEPISESLGIAATIAAQNGSNTEREGQITWHIVALVIVSMLPPVAMLLPAPEFRSGLKPSFLFQRTCAVLLERGPGAVVCHPSRCKLYCSVHQERASGQSHSSNTRLG